MNSPGAGVGGGAGADAGSASGTGAIGGITRSENAGGSIAGMDGGKSDRPAATGLNAPKTAVKLAPSSAAAGAGAGAGAGARAVKGAEAAPNEGGGRVSEDAGSTRTLSLGFGGETGSMIIVGSVSLSSCALSESRSGAEGVSESESDPPANASSTLPKILVNSPPAAGPRAGGSSRLDGTVFGGIVENADSTFLPKAPVKSLGGDSTGTDGTGVMTGGANGGGATPGLTVSNHIVKSTKELMKSVTTTGVPSTSAISRSF